MGIPSTDLTDAEILDVIERIESFALASGYFDSVNGHEPKSSPRNGVTCSVWVQTLRPIRASGQGAASVLYALNARVYTSMTQQPFDSIDPTVTAAANYLCAAICADFQLGGADGVRNVDVFGANGVMLGATAGYIEIDRNMFRVMTVTIPILINDAWSFIP